MKGYIMSTKPANKLLYAFDCGNGAAKGISSETRGLVNFEPVIAPISDKRALSQDREKPTFSLKVDDALLVFGVEDVFEHGKRAGIRRLNSSERYLSPDYFRMLDVLFLHVFAGYRGNSQPITPTGAISIPVSQFNDAQVVEEIRKSLVGERRPVDYEGCELRLEIDSKRLLIMPESTGALFHYAYDPKTLRKREAADTTGTTLIVDIGYETTDCSLFEGLKYQRDRAFTIPRSGTGIIAREVQEYARKSLRDADVSRIDKALQDVAGVKPGAAKRIDPTPGVWIDITAVYDSIVADLAARIAQEVQTLYPESVSRIVLAGGGAYHLKDGIISNLTPIVVDLALDPEAANALGAFTYLNIQAQKS
jgi:hypothetical protein